MTVIIDDHAEAARLLEQDDVIAIDTETTGLNPWRDEIALIQLCGNNTKTPILLRNWDRSIPPVLQDLLTTNKLFIGHNLGGFDLLFLHTHGGKYLNTRWYDTMVGECLISTTGRRDVSKSLRATLKRRSGVNIDKNIEHGHWRDENLSVDQVTYAASDVVNLVELREDQLKRLEEQKQLAAAEMEMELLPWVANMTCNGLPLNAAVLNDWLAKQRELAEESEKKLYGMFGTSDINLNSTQQLRKAIKACTGVEMKSTSKETLVEYAEYATGPISEVCRTLLDYREPAQRIKMYSPEWQRAYIIDNWVHPRFWQVGTDTLRFSSSDPNAQQIPKNGRFIIGNLPGYSIVSADYSQIEVRIAAHLARDQAMEDILRSEDVHRGVASQVFRIPENQVTQEQRKQAKALTFSLLFGGGAGVLYDYSRASGTSITHEESENMLHTFFTAFDGLRQMRAKAYRMSQDLRVVTITLPNGAKRVLTGEKKKPTTILNTVVQGSAAIGIKYAMLEAARRGIFDGRIGAQVHDELVAVVPDAEVADYKREIEAAMIDGMHRAMPNMLVKVEVKDGYQWQP